jgi:hypothetical protein
MAYTKDRGFGFEPGAQVVSVDRSGTAGAGQDPLHQHFITGEKPFYFSAHVPAEGNYRVTVTLGDAAGESTTTIKAELRRLMVEKVHTESGQFATVSFIVNTRTPKIPEVDGITAGVVRLKSPRESVMEAWGWDDLLTLEFNNARPAICAIEIAPVDVPTVFLIGDSTMCDQPREPFSSWGQMLPNFFQPDIAVANHAESGETYRDSIGRRRLDKILSLMKPGDYLIMQFGHNDQKADRRGHRRSVHHLQGGDQKARRRRARPRRHPRDRLSHGTPHVQSRWQLQAVARRLRGSLPAGGEGIERRLHRPERPEHPVLPGARQGQGLPGLRRPRPDPRRDAS